MNENGTYAIAICHDIETLRNYLVKISYLKQNP